MIIYLIRHGKTKGNIENRFVGSTDEPLCIDGINDLKSKKYPIPDIVVCSNKKRCTETARILFKEKEVQIVSNLCECNFGEFEYKCIDELKKQGKLSNWCNCKENACFPNGESINSFKNRCCQSFCDCIHSNTNANSIAFVVHQGTVMSIMERYDDKRKKFTEYKLENGQGYFARLKLEKICLTDVTIL